jgi:phosphinothricin acetyltransferase
MKENEFHIRLIQSRDTDDTLDIYRPYVENTIISFEYEVPSREDWIKRIETNTAEYPWLVCEHQNKNNWLRIWKPAPIQNGLFLVA